MKEKIFNIIDEEVYQKAKNLYSLLKKSNLTIAFAESITGGYISSAMVMVPGVSEVFKGAIIAYANDIKEKLLNSVSIKEHGAVSPAVAEEMVKGLIKVTNANIGISVTGIAGPTGGTETKPIGLVYFGFYSGGTPVIVKKLFKGNRYEIIKQVVKFAFELAIDNITI